MSEKERLVELLLESEPIKERDLDDGWGDNEISDIAEYLLKNKADFAEIVRCKDCKHWNNLKQKYDSFIGIKSVNGIGECRCSQWDASEYFWCTTDENDFCSYGERRCYK